MKKASTLIGIHLANAPKRNAQVAGSPDQFTSSTSLLRGIDESSTYTQHACAKFAT